MALEGLLGGLLPPARAKPKTSPVIGFRNETAIPVDGFILFDFETEAKTRDWFPFGSLKVLNNDEANIIEVYINGSTKNFFTVLNRASEMYEGSISKVTIVNKGASEIALDKIVLNVWTE